MKKALKLLSTVVVVVGAVNFLWFVVESLQLGGDGLNGYVRDGHYYVSAHGVDTEVTRHDWEFSRAHALSVFVTIPLGMLAMFHQQNGNDLSAFRYADRRAMAKTVRLTRHSGPVIAQSWGYVSLSGTRCEAIVSLCPGGLVIEPRLLVPPFALPKESLWGIQQDPQLPDTEVRIFHGAPIANPVVFRLRRPDEGRFVNRLQTWLRQS